jgi:hypothetical protein
MGNADGVGLVDRAEHGAGQALDPGLEVADRVKLSTLSLVILTNPTPNRGAKLVKTVYRVQAQAKAIAGSHR